MEDKYAMEKLTRINLTLYQRLNQSKEAILVLSYQLQILQEYMKFKKPSTENRKLTRNNISTSQRAATV